MYYILKEYSGNETRIEGDNSLFEVNKLLRKKDYRSITLCLGPDTYFVDLMLQQIVAKGRDVDLDFTKCTGKVSCINRLRTKWIINPDGSKESEESILFGFEVENKGIRYLEIKDSGFILFLTNN